MEKNIVEGRMPDMAIAGPDHPERFAHRLCRDAQARCFIFDNRKTGVRGYEADAEEHEWHHLRCNFIRFARTRRHFQSRLGRKGKPAQALNSPKVSRAMSRASCVWRHQCAPS